MESLISRRGLLGVASLFSARGWLLTQPTLRAQQAQTYSTDVNVVNVFATVRDKQGHMVRDLAKEDFAVEEDGRSQTIRYFAKESDLPLTLGLVVDTSPSQRRVLEEERNASYKFFDQVLREDRDQGFVIHFDSEVELLQDLTSSRKQLDAGIRQLEAAPPRQLNRRDSPSPGGGRRGGGTSLYDAVLLASDELMKKQTGRKALIVLSDGVDNASRVSLTDAIASAQRADTLVYSILFADEQPYRGNMGGFGGGRGMGRRGGGGPGRMPENRTDGKKTLERLSKETGGSFYEASSRHPLDKTYEQIQEELRNQYSLGYTPEKTDTGPGFRRIRVTILRKGGFVAQARDGYYAAK